MELVGTTLAVYAGINVFGLIWTAATIQFGLPDNLRIQNRPHHWSTLRERLPLVFLNQGILMALIWMAISQFGDAFSTEIPPWTALAAQLALIIVVDDAWFYGWHRIMHEHKGLYNRVHRIHHKAYAPLPIEYIYVHPLEWMVGGIGPCLGLALVNVFWGAIPAWTLWLYLLVRNLHELDVHSGIKSPLGLKVPLYAPAEHHDLHHAKPTKGNYASTLTLWDKVFRTHWRPDDAQAG
jgi:sterol desaturase/sphingolipid hydroxylase (fatty acid hydroxylase superfamily)